ncbi:MAG TPA: enolase C-terminal domain-like protein [Bryobacteraceae bacterium]|nr:enolase C-terminal domain-like protein [Bryobacteraceae bacterium]
MKVVDIKITPVTVPMEAPLRWSMGVETGTTRGIIEVITDEGITGIGETYGGNAVEHAIATAKPFILGLDPLETGVLHHRLGVFRIGYETAVPAVVRGGIEMACLDAAGKALGRPVYSLLGGKVRDRVEVAAYLFYRYRSADEKLGGEDSPESMLERARDLVARYGFRAIKLKGGVYPPDEELQCIRLLREEFPQAPLRWDPNAGWSVETSIRIGRKLLAEGIDLEYLEDPTWNLEGMSQVRQAVSIPLATNMCLVSFEQLAPGIRMRSVDIILADVHFWGGLRENQRMMTVCEAFQLGVGLHSDRELGISTAAMLHLAAASPAMAYAIDSHYHDQVDDIITEPFRYCDGSFAIPSGPGLGVEVDWDKVEKYNRLYQQQGQVNEFYDARRPRWVPALPIF